MRGGDRRANVNKSLDLQRYRKLLLAEQERLIAEHHAVSADLAERSGDLADYDDHHPADAASETFERTKDYALDENYRDMLERISEALRKIEDGTYGTCDRCDTPINADRLKAIPYATLCIECQERMEIR
jgi:DnaK suppressor protein